MNRVVLNLATSLDGFISRKDGDVSWLQPFHKKGQDYGLRAFFKTLGSTVMGANTWRKVLKLGGGSYPGMANDVVTHRRPAAPSRHSPAYFSGDLRRLIRDIRKDGPGKDIWLVGGGMLIRGFLEADLIDRFIITIVPVLLGSGIPLFRDARRVPAVLLARHKVYPEGVVQLTYDRVR